MIRTTMIIYEYILQPWIYGGNMSTHSNSVAIDDPYGDCPHCKTKTVVSSDLPVFEKLPEGFVYVGGVIVWAPRQPLWYRVLWRLFHPLEALRDYAYEVQRRSGGLFGDNDDWPPHADLFFFAGLDPAFLSTKKTPRFPGVGWAERGAVDSARLSVGVTADCTKRRVLPDLQFFWVTADGLPLQLRS